MTKNNDQPCAQKDDQTARAIAMLEAANLRVTAQRLALLCLLTRDGHCHMTAEALFEKASAAGNKVSLATVYNTLRTLTRAGLLKQVAMDTDKIYFDTNTEEHHHIYDETTGVLTDLPASALAGVHLPSLPAGVSVKSIDLVVRVCS